MVLPPWKHTGTSLNPAFSDRNFKVLIAGQNVLIFPEQYHVLFGAPPLDKPPNSNLSSDLESCAKTAYSYFPRGGFFAFNTTSRNCTYQQSIYGFVYEGGRFSWFQSLRYSLGTTRFPNRICGAFQQSTSLQVSYIGTNETELYIMKKGELTLYSVLLKMRAAIPLLVKRGARRETKLQG